MANEGWGVKPWYGYTWFVVKTSNGSWLDWPYEKRNGIFEPLSLEEWGDNNIMHFDDNR
ncbi:MAG TPA: hypothetical protein VKE98_13620 [Gemmataceae bacterium]|nr:hypothetical protein [Gemmataceae bacterium]